MNPESMPEQPHAHTGELSVSATSASGDLDDHPARREIEQRLIPDRRSREFLPCSDLTEIFGIETVNDILGLGRSADGSRRSQIDAERDICGEGAERKRIKIFAILVFIGNPNYIGKFISGNIWDDQLPLDTGQHGHFFKTWKGSVSWAFCEWQYKVLAPVINFTATNHKVFSPDYPMPFLDVLEWENGGAHGRVSKIRIHQDHQIWAHVSESREYFAIKHFHPNHNGTFEREREALTRFSRPNQTHDNLIELLFSYQIGSDQYLIFPWADCNLQEYWRDNNSQPSETDDLIWLFKQCHGLADGLCEVHRYHGLDDDAEEGLWNEKLGRHGDIKPKNILFFGSKGHRGRLVVADFTLMRFHAPNVDNTYANKLRGYSETYRPPEVGRGIQVTQKYDIWTLGCVFLEFITWHLIGYEAIYKDRFKGPDGRDYESFGTVRLSDDNMSEEFVHDKFFIPAEVNPDQEPKAQVKESVKKASKPSVHTPNLIWLT